MKHLLLTTIAAVLVVGCGPQPPDISIHKAAYQGNIEAVKQHLAAGTDVNAEAKSGLLGRKTPLHMAAWGGHREVAKLLIANGAEVNVKGNDGWTPLYSAALYGYKEITQILIANGADVNAKREGGSTPLHGAAEGGHGETVKLLIAAGADLNAKTYDRSHPRHHLFDKAGKTPLDWAIKYNQTETAALLRKHGGKTAEELKAEGK